MLIWLCEFMAMILVNSGRQEMKAFSHLGGALSPPNANL
jgi:hypothetical protein